MAAITFVVCVLFVVLLMAGQSLKAEIRANDEVRLELTEQLRLENERTDSIRALKDYYESEDYLRQAAKERLGLIEEGDIIFRRAE